MKVLHVIPSLKKGGAERLVLDICIALSSIENIECKLVVFRPDDDYKFLSDKISLEVIPSAVVPSISRSNQVNVDALQKFVDAFNPDVIHSHLFEAEIVLSQIKNEARRIVHFHNNIPEFQMLRGLNKQKIGSYYERRMVLKNLPKSNTMAITISEDAQTYARQNLPKWIDCRLLHNAIDLNRFESPVQSKGEIRLVNTGSFVLKKGQSLAIETLAILRKKGFEVELDLLGDGELKTKLQAQARELNVATYVQFHGKVDYPEKFLSEATVYLHTASYEPFGLVLIEAMAAGLPIVTTDGFGNRDLIQDGVNGFMVWERDAGQLADQIEILLKNEALRLEMGRNAQNFSRNYDISAYIKKLMGYYNP